MNVCVFKCILFGVYYMKIQIVRCGFTIVKYFALRRLFLLCYTVTAFITSRVFSCTLFFVTVIFQFARAAAVYLTYNFLIGSSPLLFDIFLYHRPPATLNLMLIHLTASCSCTSNKLRQDVGNKIWYINIFKFISSKRNVTIHSCCFAIKKYTLPYNFQLQH